MTIIAAIFAAIFISESDAAALRTTAPEYLSIESSRHHLAAARLAGTIYFVDPDLLLATAWYESRYNKNTVGPVVRGKTACGVLQPTMQKRCEASPSLLTGYLEGAAHLKEWITASHGNLDTALIGYAGGYSLIQKCRAGEVPVVRNKRTINLCTVAMTRLRRAQWIKRVRSRAIG